MAFNVTYGALQSRNIKHLYTTREKTMHKVVPRHQLYRPEFLEIELAAKDRHRRRKAARIPNMEYIPEFDISIPRAPAFRKADSSYVDSIVERLSQNPRVKSNPRGCEKYQKGFMEYEWEEDSPASSPRVSNKRMKSILTRLTKPKADCGRRHPSPDLREDDYLPNFTI